MNDDDQWKIQELIKNGFPEQAWAMPGEVGHDPAALYENEAGDLAHLAVNSNDKTCREVMRSSVTDVLFNGGQLPVAARAWLIFVLANLKDLPHNGKGRPKDGLAELQTLLRLLKFVEDDEETFPSKAIQVRIEDAAKMFNKSYESIRAIYYSDRFKKMRLSLGRSVKKPPI